MSMYRIKPEYIDELCGGVVNPDTIFDEDQVAEDAQNFGMDVDEYIDKYMDVALWYALQQMDDNDWGTGTYDRDQAIEKLISDDYYARIAIIDGSECIGEINRDEVVE